jgi:misacylated tRNA(Ala) deacylase
MTETLFRTDPYLKEAEAVVVALTPEGGIVLDRTIFYPSGGGQPGDAGVLSWGGGEIAIATTVKGEGGAIVLIPGEAAALPEGARGCSSRSTGTAGTATCASTRRCTSCRW